MFIEDDNGALQKHKTKIVIGLMAAGVAAVTIYKGVKEDQMDLSDQFSNMHPNELFCRAPGFDDNFVLDPFASLNAKAMPVDDDKFNLYDHFWSVASVQPSQHMTIDFSFKHGGDQTNDRADFFETIPEHVKNNPNYSFIITGHATDDLDDHFRRGVPISDEFMRRYKNHLQFNKQLVEQRLDTIEQKLIDAGIPKDRITRHNLNTRHDKRAVDLEVCVPQNE